MAKTTARPLETLLQKCAWEDARKQIEQELKSEPDDHWLLTQLGVTYYEQGRYRDSLPPLLKSLDIVPDCPLTLWNVAGALDALGKSEVSIPIYTWLLRSKKSAADDPCWESEEWADSLKTDCVYRVGVCFQHMERWASTENCFRQYINLILAGRNGTYAVEDAARNIRELRRKSQHHTEEVREAIESTLRDSGVRSLRGGNGELPRLSLPELLGT